MSIARLSEIFKSIQGEGPYAGVSQVFVRFFECHMHCSWCDTPDSIGDGKREFEEYTLARLLKAVRPLARGCHSVSLTGGEPLLQAVFMKAAIPELRKLGLKIYLETSGVLHQKLAEVIADVDIVSMDIKLPSSTGCRSFWAEHAAFLKIARRKECFVKMVISRKTSQADVVQAAKLVKCEDPDLLVILQPNSFEMNSGAVARCEQLQRVCQKDLSDVRIVPQMHKFMKLR